jgi:hypothetical protein
MESAAYVVLCVAIPAAWGAISAWFFTRRDRRRGRLPNAEKRPPLDYSI